MFDSIQFGFTRKLPLILQTEAAECGLAALAMIASFHGYQIDLATLRANHTVSLKGATLAQLMKIATALGLQSRPVRLDMSDLERLPLPCILHWDLHHFVVLKQVRPSTLEIFDPARGRRILSLDMASRSFTGIALELAPGLKFERKRERRQLRLGVLLEQVRGFRGTVAKIFALAVAMEVFGLSIPFFSQWVIDDVLVSGDADLLVVLTVGLLLVGLLQVAAGWLRAWIVMHLTTMLNMHWTSSVFSHLMRLPIVWFEKRHLGDVVTRFGSIAAMQQALTSGMIGAVIDGAMTLVTLAVMLVYNPMLSLVAVITVLLYAAVRVLRYSAMHSASGEQLVRAARQQTFFMESVRGIQPIKLFNRELDRARRFMNLVVGNTNAGLTLQRQAMTFNALNGALVVVENALILYLGARLALGGHFSVGMLIAFLGYKGQFVSRASTLVDQLLNFKMLGLQTERLADIVLSKTERQTPISGVSHRTPHKTGLSIELHNIRFRYAPGEPWILDGVTLSIEAGESVAVVGPSGCGKTTLLKIMLGQLQPEEGEVLVDGVPIQQLGLQPYRERIGVVMQDDRLFAGSLSENIAFFDPRIDHARVEEVARRAAVHDEIARMTMGYNSLVGDMGSVLSGGQRQRVLLARALYKTPQMLFLDEATSSLDAATESAVNEAVRTLSITRIVIAHRQQTIEAMDRVIMLRGKSPSQPVQVDGVAPTA